jgi:hypothetical protein
MVICGVRAAPPRKGAGHPLERWQSTCTANAGWSLEGVDSPVTGTGIAERDA